MAVDVKWVALFSGQGAQRVERAQRMRSSLPEGLRAAWVHALADAGVGVDDLDDTALTANRVAQPTLCAREGVAIAIRNGKRHFVVGGPEAALATFGAATLAGALRLPMLSCIDARVLRTADDVVAALSRQIATPLDWVLCMDTIAERGPSAVLEIGPGNALARMLAERMPELPARSLDDFRDPASAVEWIARQAHEA